MSFDIWEIFLPKADKYGQKVGALLPDFVSGLYQRVKDKFQLDWSLSFPMELKPLIPEIIEAAAGGTKIDRGSIPFKGKLGDEVCEYVNEFKNAAALKAAETLANGKPVTKDNGKMTYERLDPDRPGYIINSHYYPDDCSHPKGKYFTRKGEPRQDPIPMREAIRRGHLPDCLCVGTQEEIDRLIVSLTVPPVPKPEVKADKKPGTPIEEPAVPAPECKLPLADHTLFSLWEKLCKENYEWHGVRDQFVRMALKDQQLLEKFFAAFHGRGTYEQFRALVTLNPYDRWKFELDCLLGRAKEPKSLLQQEQEQTKRAIAALVKWLRSGSQQRELGLRVAKLKADLAKAEYHEDEHKAKTLRAQIAELEA